MVLKHNTLDSSEKRYVAVLSTLKIKPRGIGNVQKGTPNTATVPNASADTGTAAMFIYTTIYRF